MKKPIQVLFATKNSISIQELKINELKEGLIVIGMMLRALGGELDGRRFFKKPSDVHPNYSVKR